MRAPLLLLVTLGVGLGVGYLLGAGTGGSTPAPRQAQRPAAPADTAPKPVLPSGSSDLAKALREVPPPRVQGGTLSVTGYVRTPKGEPVAGAVVRAVRQPSRHGSWRRTGDGAPQKRDLVDEVRKYVERFHRTEMTTVEAVADSAGFYELKGLTGDRHTFAAYLTGYDVKIKGERNTTLDVHAGKTVDFEARRVVDVPVDVLLPDGTRPERAWVYHKTGNSSQGANWSPRRPSIRVPPGSYTFYAQLQNGNQYKSDEIERDVPDAGAVERIVIQLKGRPGIRGSVRFETVESFRNVQVYALRYRDRKPTDKQLVTNGKQTWVWSNQSYTYTIPDLAPGRYLVGAAVGRRHVVVKQTVDVGQQMVTCDLTITKIDPGLYVVLKIFDPAGEPLTDVDLSTSYRVEGSSSSGGGSWIKRKDGSFLVLHHAHDNEEGGDYGVKITSKKHGTKEVRYKRADQAELEVHFKEAAKLEVTVAGYAGSEHTDLITISLVRRDADQNRRFAGSHESKAPDADGRATLGPVETGDYEVVLYAKLARHNSMEVLARPVTIRSGSNQATLQMPTFHPLVVVAEGMKKGAQLTLQRENARGWAQIYRKVDADGRVDFGKLPAGRYKLTSWGGGKSGEMTVVLPGAAEVIFRPQEQNALRVRITDRNGTLARGGLLDGDLVIGLDGTEFKTMLHAQMLLSAAMSKEQVVLTVLRGARRLEVTLNLKAMMEAGGDMGGRLDPTVR